MSKLTLNWEDHDKFYDDFQKEGFTHNDIHFKTRFNFFSNKLTFKHNSKFTFCEKGACAQHDITVKHSIPSGYVEVKEKSGEINVKTDYNHLNQDCVSFDTFHNTRIYKQDEGQDTNSKLLLRFHHKDNFLLAAGFEDFKASKGVPEILSLGASYGKVIDGVRYTLNGLTHLHNDTRSVKFLKFFLFAKDGDFNKLIQANFNRKPDQEKSDIDLSLKFTNQICESTKVGGAFTYDVDKKRTTSEVVLLKKFDKVNFHAKANSNKEAFIGITSQLEDITLNISVKKALHCKNSEESLDKKGHWLDFSFGASVEFRRI